MAVNRDKINRDKVLQEAQKLVEKKRFDKAIVELQKSSPKIRPTSAPCSKSGICTSSSSSTRTR